MIISAKTNPENRFDVNNDAVVSPQDALIVINNVNGGEAETTPVDVRYFYLDVSGDGIVAPLDALAIINYLNGNQQLEIAFAAFNVGPEGEYSASGQKVVWPPRAAILQAAADQLAVADNWFAGARTGDSRSQAWQPATNLKNDHHPEARRELSLVGADTSTTSHLSDSTIKHQHRPTMGGDAVPSGPVSAMDRISVDGTADNLFENCLDWDHRSSIFARWPGQRDDDSLVPFSGSQVSRKSAAGR